ncbi:MAG: hypothetical protein COA63_008520 [Methylophaga sp.]|nr:hypothetical protein [Methylophaga sp.]
MTLALSLVLLLPFSLHAKEKYWYNYDHLYFQTGTYFHFGGDDDKDYAGPRIFTSLEAVKANNWLYGLSLFNNSFGQFSQYMYGGKSWNYHGNWQDFHTKVTMGLIHGYKDEFEDKIPLNDFGFAPAIIPSIGYKKNAFGFDTILLGFNAVLFTIGMDI